MGMEMRSLNKLEWGIVALCVVITGVTVYSFTQITTLQTDVSSLILRIIEKDKIINTLEESLDGRTIKIGYIAAQTQDLTTAKPFLEKIILPDMNAYCRQIGRNVTFQFRIEDAQGLAPIHLEKVQAFNSKGITVFIGGLWSSQAGGSHIYVDENHMLMLSYSSTSPTFAIVDRLIRTCPSDSYTTPALVEMMWSYGIRHVCFIQRGDSWGDGIFMGFEYPWKAKGGDFIGEHIRYNETESNFSECLAIAEQQINDALAKGYKLEEIGGVLLSFDEAPLIISQAKDYSAIFSVKWFGAESTAKSASIRDQVPEGADLMRLYSLLPSELHNGQYTKLESRYTALTGNPLGLGNARLYDTAMIIMKAMLLADSDNADDIVDLIPILCDDYYGVSGLCSLNKFGDRVPPPYDIWGYGVVEGRVEFVRYGGVDPVTGKVSWDADSR
jgi:branched-chain amino acid transport system substrate-binding protein